MKKIKVYLMHSSVISSSSVEDKLQALQNWLRIDKELYQQIEFVWDEKETDYVFVTEDIYYGKYAMFFRKKLKQFLKNNVVIL